MTTVADSRQAQACNGAVGADWATHHERYDALPAGVDDALAAGPSLSDPDRIRTALEGWEGVRIAPVTGEAVWGRDAADTDGFVLSRAPDTRRRWVSVTARARSEFSLPSHRDSCETGAPPRGADPPSAQPSPTRSAPCPLSPCRSP